jgi:hypothetical protein
MPDYDVSIITARSGKKVVRLEFDTIPQLETFFLDELIGTELLDQSETKTIGTVLLIWDK